MRISRIRSWDESASWTAAWNRLAGGIPFRRSEWLGTWWQNYRSSLELAGRSIELYLLGVFDQQQLVAIAPWYLERSRAGGAVVRLLGSGEVCSDYLTVLCEPDRQGEVIEALAIWLTNASTHPESPDDAWEMLVWDQTEAADPALGQLADRLAQAGCAVHQAATESTWRIELPETSEQYLELLSKSHRKQLRQLQRRLVDSGRAVLRTAETSAELTTGWQTLVDLHQRRMESLGKPGSFHSPTFTRFHRAVTESLHQAGLLDLHWLEIDGRAVAAEYHLTGPEMVFAYQGGVEPDALELEPGRLITSLTLQRAIDRGARAFDFCRGDEPYKAHFRATARANVSWRIVSNVPTARLRHGLWLAGQSARHWVKHGLQFVGGLAK